MKKSKFTDFEQFKKNELLFQNNKYGKRGLASEAHKTSIDVFYQKFLTPKHLKCGNDRGLLFNKAVDELLKYNIKDKRILDYCCGRGDLGIFLAQKGANVCGFDFLEKAIEIAKFKAEINKLNVKFEKMDAENLLYANDYFDLIIGFEALHHVILYPKVVSELKRIVREGGKIIFAEPWGGAIQFFKFGVLRPA